MKINKWIEGYLSEKEHGDDVDYKKLKIGDTIKGLSDTNVIVLNQKTFQRQGGSGSHYELVGEHLGKQFKVVLTGKELDAICKGWKKLK